MTDTEVGTTVATPHDGRNYAESVVVGVPPRLVEVVDAIVAPEDDFQKWLAERCSGITGTDVHNIVAGGGGPYLVWARKTGRTPIAEKETLEALSVDGLLQESPIMALCQMCGEGGSDLRQGSLYKPPLLRSKKHPLMLGSPDRLYDGETLDVVEIKVRRHRTGWGVAGTDQIPDPIRYQVEHYAAIVGAQRCRVMVRWRSGLPEVFEWEASAELHAAMADLVESFWERHVKRDIPPDIDPEGPGAREAAQRRFPQPLRIEYRPAVEAELETFEALRITEETLADVQRQYEAQKTAAILLVADDAGVLLPDGSSISYSARKGKRSIDTDALLYDLQRQYNIPQDVLAEAVNRATKIGNPGRTFRPFWKDKP